MTLSNLSKTPPWPGIIFPKSFILRSRLIREKHKSPKIAIGAPITESKNTLK